MEVVRPMRWLLIAVLFLAAAWPASAQPRLMLADEQPDVDAWPAVGVLADPGGTLDVAAVQQRAGDFRPPATPHANLGVRRDVVWLRIPLAVRGDGRWLLDLDYPSLDRIDAFVLRGGRVVQQAALGDHLTYGARPMPARSHTLPLQLQAGDAQELLLRVQTTSTMVVPVRLVKAGTYWQGEMVTQLGQGLAAGLGLCLLAYAVAHWAGSRDPMFLHYGVTIFGTTLFFFSYYGLGSQHLWAQHAWLTSNAAPFFVLVALGGGLLLTERILDVRSLHPRVAALAMALGGVAFGTAALFAAGIVSYRGAHLAGTLLGPLPMALAVPYSVLRWRQGDAAAPYIFAGWGVYAVGVAVMATLLRGGIDSNAWTQHAHQASAIFEMLMWLRVLGLRNEQARARADRADREREVMQVLAHTDALTGLPNRRGLQIEMQAALRDATPQQMLGLFVADLDGFKAVNDRLGHDAGDELLQAVAQRLKGCLRQRDVVARLGGDEFVILARDLPGDAVAAQIGRKLVAALAQPFTIQGQACRVGLTLGYAVAPADGRDEAALFKRADAAMYAGKQAGKGQAVRAETVPA